MIENPKKGMRVIIDSECCGAGWYNGEHGTIVSKLNNKMNFDVKSDEDDKNKMGDFPWSCCKYCVTLLEEKDE